MGGVVVGGGDFNTHASTSEPIVVFLVYSLSVVCCVLIAGKVNSEHFFLTFSTTSV